MLNDKDGDIALWCYLYMMFTKAERVAPKWDAVKADMHPFVL